MSLRTLSHWTAVTLLLVMGAVSCTSPLWGQEEVTRKVKSKVAPTYPDLAKRMSISGVVKVLVTVDKSGNVKTTKLVGGHPVLAGAAMDAVKKWKYETGSDETTGIVEFHFDPNQ